MYYLVFGQVCDFHQNFFCRLGRIRVCAVFFEPSGQNVHRGFRQIRSLLWSPSRLMFLADFSHIYTSSKALYGKLYWDLITNIFSQCIHKYILNRLKYKNFKKYSWRVYDLLKQSDHSCAGLPANCIS